MKLSSIIKLVYRRYNIPTKRVSTNEQIDNEKTLL